MVVRGRVRNGVVVPEIAGALPEGAEVRVQIVGQHESDSPGSLERRQGGWWKGQVQISPDFDQLPDDIAEAFGMPEQ